MAKYTHYDYIVVGSGAGGGTLAARLAEAGCTVLVLEAGGDPKALKGGNAAFPDENRLPEDYEVPVFHALSTENKAMKWDFWVRHYANNTQQLRDPKYRKEQDGVLYPRAGTLGGCTAHNAMIMVYPHNSDWDGIAKLTGDASWSADNMRTYFERLENCHHRLVPPWRWIWWLTGWNPTRHGFNGWLSTEKALPRRAIYDTKVVRTILKSAKHALKVVGDPVNRVTWFFEGKADPNDWRLVKKNAVGIRYPPLSTRGHARMGTREFLLETRRKHPNLEIELDALATKVLFDDRNRAIGVEYLKGERLYRAHFEASAEPGTLRVVHAAQEVILAGGAFNTPQLLMLSGIGPREQLKKLNIDVRVDLPGVGCNLQDRYEVGYVNRMKEDWHLLERARFEKGDPLYKRWQHRKGVYTTNGAVLAVIKRSFTERKLPDLFCFALLGRFRGYEPDYSKDLVENHNYLTWAVLKAHTENTAGTVELNSDDPRDPPKINFRYFEEGNDKSGEDLRSVVSGVKFVREATEPISDLIEEEEVPGKSVEDDEDLKQFVRDNAWGHHASCTCKIGAHDDASAVLDSNFRVRGVQGLRVVDASVFPRIPGFFIVSAVYMIAEKAADVILTEIGRSLAPRKTGWWALISGWLRGIWRVLWRTTAAIVVLLATIIGFSWFVYEPNSGPSTPDEEKVVIRNLADLLSNKLKAQYKNGDALRDTHPKANACVRAKLTIDKGLRQTFADVNWLGKDKAGDIGDLGIFENEGRTYNSWIRFSNAADQVTPDTERDFRGMAIKLFDVEGEKFEVPAPGFLRPDEPDDDDEKLTQDFFFIAHDAFFAGTPQHFRDFFAAAVEGGEAAPNNLPVIWHLLTHPKGAYNLVVGRKVYPSIADIRWFSVAPFKLGNAEIKYSALPCEPVVFQTPAAETESPNYLRRRLRERLDPNWAGAGICLDFNIQFRMKESQPIDDTLTAWDAQTVSPWFRVAQLNIPPQEFLSPEQADFCESITFNPWHSLKAHMPIGGINNARRDVMFKLQQVRLQMNGKERFKPTGNEYFFPGASFPWTTPPPK